MDWRTRSLLKDNFCSSPWLHIRVAPDGHFWPCRWAWDGISEDEKFHVRDFTIQEFFQQSTLMQGIRIQMLNGERPDMCKVCHQESSMGKVSGRQRQLLKSGIIEKDFNKSFCSTKHFIDFKHSYQSNGHTLRYPTDLQIDLGNTCNSSCIMCRPMWSSKVQNDHAKLNKVEPDIFPIPDKFRNWTQDQESVEHFVSGLEQIGPDLKYVHFLGGETLYMQAFWDITERMAEIGFPNTTVGTTTNCTIYDPRIEQLVKKFKTINLGLSIESITPLNNYVRYPADIDTVMSNIEKYIALRENHNLHLSLRITPNVLSIYHMDQLLDWMIENNIMAESCNILSDPAELRTELLPVDLRTTVLQKLNGVVNRHGLQKSSTPVINRRRQENNMQVINDIVFEYIDFIENYQEPDNIIKCRKNLVKYLTAYENMRGNNILEYLPEYEKFLRSHGYSR